MRSQLATNVGGFPSFSPLPPSQLLQACRAGDERAWQDLLDQYAGLVYSIPLHYGLSHESATDIAKIVFISLLQSLESLCDNSNLEGWLLLVARRHTWRAVRCRQQASGAQLHEASLTLPLPAPINLGEIALTVPPPIVNELLLYCFIDQTQLRQRPGLFQRRQAAQTFDSLHQPLPVGVRTGSFETTHQYVYAIDSLDLLLHIQPGWSGARLDLIGQILPNGAGLITDPFVAQLLHKEQEVAITLTDEIGSFGFEALEPGSYALLLGTDTLEIEVPVFALTHEYAGRNWAYSQPVTQ